MKLGYLISQYPAVNHTYILREVQALRSRGVEICVVSIRPCDRPRKWLSPAESDEERRTFSILGSGLRHIIGAQLRVLLGHPLRYLRGLAFALKLTRGTPRLLLRYPVYFAEAMVAGEHFVRRGVRDIHTHYASTVLLILSRVFPVRYSLTIHGSGEFVDVAGFHMARKVADARLVVTVSLYGKSQVMNASDPVHWSKIEMIPLGVDAAAFGGPAADPAPAANDPTVAVTRPFRVLSVGHLSHMKGYPILIEAVQRLRQRGHSVELTIVGEGTARPALEQLIRRDNLGACVRLAGACNHQGVVEHYRASDAFALASFLEGVPVVLMEAMAMRLPCVATAITGIPELIEGGVSGLLVPPASVEHLADAIERLIGDRALRRRLGEAARRKILADFDLARNSARLYEVFSRCLEQAIALQPVVEAS